MKNDDRQVGRILSRREVLALFGTAGAAILAGCVPGLSDTEQLATEPTQTPQSGPAIVPTSVTTQATPLAYSGTLPRVSCARSRRKGRIS